MVSEARARSIARQQLILTHPGVSWHKSPTACDGFMNKTALKHIFGTDEQRAQRPRCKKVAHWHFKTLKSRGRLGVIEKDGDYCWSHLLSRGLYGSMEEEERTRRWRERMVKAGRWPDWAGGDQTSS